MKFIIIAALSMFSVASFAKDLDSTIRDIEIDRNAKCSKIKTSWGLNLGGPFGPTYYTVHYSCLTNDSDFGLKVRMRDSKVRKVIFVQ